MLPLLIVAVAQGADIYWTNTAGGNWSAATNWSTGTVPGSSDNAFMVSAGTYTVTLDISATVLNLTVAYGHVHNIRTAVRADIYRAAVVEEQPAIDDSKAVNR